MRSLFRITLLGLGLSLTSLNSSAQMSEDHIKHCYFFDVNVIETPEMTIEFSGAQAQQQFVSVKMTITNKTNDYILYNVNESSFLLPSGPVKIKSTTSIAGLVKGSKILIEPKGKESVLLKMKEVTNFHVKDIKVDLKGFNRVSSKGKVTTAPDFTLPASNNNFETGPFECVLNKSEQKTQETAAEFECTYKGEQVAIVDPSKLSITSAKLTQKYANDNKKDKAQVLYPNEKYKFDAVAHIPGKILDMQFATLLVQWNGTFTESTASPLTVPNAEFKFNQELTNTKNN